MAVDHHLPTTQEELRDMMVQAYTQGWKDRRSLVGKPMGTVIAQTDTLIDAFLASMDLPPRDKAKVVTVREAIMKLVTEAE